MSKSIHEIDRIYFELMAGLSQYAYDQEQQDEIDRAYNKAILEATGD